MKETIITVTAGEKDEPGTSQFRKWTVEKDAPDLKYIASVDEAFRYARELVTLGETNIYVQIGMPEGS